MVREARPAEVRLAEPAPLDHRPHRAVENEDPLAQGVVECLSNAVRHFHRDAVKGARAPYRNSPQVSIIEP